MRSLIPLLALLLFSCSAPENSETQKEQNQNVQGKGEEAIPQAEDPFQIFLDQFPQLDLPISLKGCEINPKGLVVFNEDHPSPYIQDYAFAVGQFPSNGEYVSVITLGAADCLLPIMTTFSAAGEQIDQKTIAIGYCGSGPCFECEEFMVLEADYSIYTADTLRTSDCDENYNPIEGTQTVKVIYREGKLTETGKIELSEEIKKQL